MTGSACVPAEENHFRGICIQVSVPAWPWGPQRIRPHLRGIRISGVCTGLPLGSSRDMPSLARHLYSGVCTGLPLGSSRDTFSAADTKSTSCAHLMFPFKMDLDHVLPALSLSFSLSLLPLLPSGIGLCPPFCPLFSPFPTNLLCEPYCMASLLFTVFFFFFFHCKTGLVWNKVSKGESQKCLIRLLHFFYELGRRAVADGRNSLEVLIHSGCY